MSQPQIKFTEDTDKTSMADLHDLVCGLAEVSFSLRGASPPTWAIGMPGRRIVIETPWADEREQLASRDFLCTLIHLFDATAYSFASEGYAATTKGGKDESIEDVRKRIDKMAERRLENLPVDQRDEILFIMSHQHDSKKMLMSRYLINSKRQGRLPFLGPRLDEDSFDTMEGRMMNLFQQQPDPERMRRATALAHAFFSERAT